MLLIRAYKVLFCRIYQSDCAVLLPTIRYRTRTAIVHKGLQVYLKMDKIDRLTRFQAEGKIYCQETYLCIFCYDLCIFYACYSFFIVYLYVKFIAGGVQYVQYVYGMY